MLETPHALLGAAVGAATGNPAAAAVTGAGSHFLTDVMPHWNPEFPFRSKLVYAFLVVDFVTSLVLIASFALVWPNRPEIAVGAFFGILPDILLGIRYVFKVRWLQPYERAHAWMHHEVAPLYGIPPQLLVSIVSVLYLKTA